MMKRLYNRGRRTSELPFLMSCALYMLDRRYRVIGLRYPWHGIRFDLVLTDPSMAERVVLVEAKYRTDNRSIMPYELREFHDNVKEIRRKGVGGCVFMTNTRFSRKSLDYARRYGIQTIDNVPIVFGLAGRSDQGKANPGEAPSQ